MIDWKELDSVVFKTLNLNRIRNFYERLLELPIAQYEKEGREVEDVTDHHVNYQIGNHLIGFEVGEKIDTGSLVLRVSNLNKIRMILEKKLTLIKSQSFFISFFDPDGREIIVEQVNYTNQV